MRSLVFASLFALACSPASPMAVSDAATIPTDAAIPPDDLATMPSDAAIGDAAGADTWTNWGRAFFATYCVECHGAGNTMRDYTTYTDVKRDETLIACGVASTVLAGCGPSPTPRQFPISDGAGTNPKPSDAVRARLVSWIAAGAPE